MSSNRRHLLDKTLEFARAGADLRQLHRLATTTYESLDDLLADYLDTGRRLLSLPTGVFVQLRGRYGCIKAAQSDSIGVLPGVSFALDDVYCGVVSGTGATVASHQTSEDPRLRERPHYGPSRQGSYIGAPVRVDSDVFGVLSFSSPVQRPSPFAARDIELIELMAEGVGQSVLESRLEHARTQAQVLEADRSAILEMVAKDVPLDAVLEQVARMVVRQMPALAIAIHSIERNRVYAVTAPGLPESYVRRVQGIRLPDDARCCFGAAITRRTEAILHTEASCRPHARDCAHDLCARACLSSPVLSASGELVGLITGYAGIAIEPPVLNLELIEMATYLTSIAMEHRRLRDAMVYQALHDDLTDLPNRTLFTRVLEQRIAEAARQRQMLAVLFIDVDRFKKVNDHLGHPAGDQVLRETACRLERCLSVHETAARLGGDEFVAVLTNIHSAEGAAARAREVLEVLREPVLMGNQSIYITASIGYSLYPDNGRTAERLLETADQAMYRVKHSGKNDVAMARAELNGKAAARSALEYALRRGLERGEFRLHYQPIVRLSGAGTPILLPEFEVLLSWDHPELGHIPPSDFIPIAEDCGAILELGKFVLEEACAQCAGWGVPARISVNVSPLQFARADFVETVQDALAGTGLAAERLELELTESAIIEDIDVSLPKLRRLRELGVTLTLDDFGTGYSSLGYLRWMPVQRIKIDHSFIGEIETSRKTLTLVQAIVAMAHSLGLEVVAEGIETEAQVQMVMELGCDRGQGHYFGHPSPAPKAKAAHA